MVEPGVPNFENRKQLEEWLRDKPQSWTAAVAVRSTLRTFPFFAREWEIGRTYEKAGRSAMLSVFRALSLSWGATRYPSKEVGVAASAAAAAATRGAPVVVHAVVADVTASATPWEIAAEDAKILDRTEEPRRLAISPLWPDGEPERFAHAYSSLQRTLINDDPSWNVWLHWYDARVKGGFMPGLGQAGEEQVMAKLARQGDAWWDRAPHEVNREITAWVDEARLQPPDIENVSAPQPQNPGALRFTSDLDAPIDVDLNADSAALNEDAAARDRHGEVRSLGQGLIGQYDPAEMGANTAITLVNDMRKYLAALGDHPNQAKADLVVIRGDGLRLTYQAQENRDEDLSDLAEISQKFLLALKKFLRAHNAYVALDPVLAAKDEGLAGPNAVKDLVPPGVGATIIQAAITAGAVTQHAGNVIEEEAKITPLDPVPENRRSRRFSEGIKNLFRAALSYVWQHKGKFATGIGTASAAIAKWLVYNETFLLKYYAESPAMLETIRGLIGFLKTLPLL